MQAQRLHVSALDDVELLDTLRRRYPLRKECVGLGPGLVQQTGVFEQFVEHERNGMGHCIEGGINRFQNHYAQIRLGQKLRVSAVQGEQMVNDVLADGCRGFPARATR